LKNKQKNENGVQHSLDVNVPSHWEVVPLEKVLDGIVGGGTPSKANPSYWEGSIPWLTIKDMRTHRPADAIDHITDAAVRESSTNVIPADTVIIATRIGLGKVIRVPYDAAINQDLKALINKPEIDKGYLEYWIISIADYLESIGSGTTVKGIRLEQLRSLPFPLAPLDQQKRIVAEIEKQFSRLDEAVANLKRVKANLKRYKAAVLKAAVEGKLTEEWRKQHPDVEPASKLLERILAERREKWEAAELTKMKAKGKVPKDDKWKKKYKEPAAPVTSDLPALPRGWVWASIAELGDVTGGLTKNPKRATLPVKLPYLRVANVYANELRLEEIKKIGVDESELAKLLINKDDLLIVEGNGSPDQIGRLAIWDGSINPCVHQNHLIKVRLSAGCLPNWAVCWLLSLDGRNCIRNVASSTSGLYTLSVGKVGGLPVPLLPLDEQRCIIAEIDRRLSLVNEILAQVDANLKRAESLRQSILSKAFSGQLIGGGLADFKMEAMFRKKARIWKTTRTLLKLR
jgi:type I restriction enzyme S subunit